MLQIISFVLPVIVVPGGGGVPPDPAAAALLFSELVLQRLELRLEILVQFHIFSSRSRLLDFSEGQLRIPGDELINALLILLRILVLLDHRLGLLNGQLILNCLECSVSGLHRPQAVTRPARGVDFPKQRVHRANLRLQ